MLRSGGKKARPVNKRLPPVTASLAWKRVGGHWVSLASVAPDAVRGTAAIEIGDIITPDSSKGMVQGNHGWAFPWYDNVPVMFVMEARFNSWTEAIVFLWEDFWADLSPGPVLTLTKVPDALASPDDDIRILPI